jgi:hypothetical protein
MEPFSRVSFHERRLVVATQVKNVSTTTVLDDESRPIDRLPHVQPLKGLVT